MARAATLSGYMAMADAEVMPRSESPRMGLFDEKCAGLRAFQRYSREATTDIYDPWGKKRWLSQKQSRIYAILDRASSSTSRLTMSAIASEAMVCTSTVSRTVQKLQAFGLFAIDVTRGRHGGIVVRKRHIGDALRHYADAAWKRIRAWINVASANPRGETGTTGTTTPKDATFTEEPRGCLVFGCDEDHGAPLALSFTAREAAETRARAEAWATDVLRERARLAIEDPWGELDAEYPIGWARELRHGVG